MTSLSLSLVILSLLSLLSFSTASYAAMTLTIVNNCPFTLWPAIQANAEVPQPPLVPCSYESLVRPYLGSYWMSTGVHNLIPALRHWRLRRSPPVRWPRWRRSHLSCSDLPSSWRRAGLIL
jgi:hypothetical protein